MLAGAGLACLSFAYLTALPRTLNPADESFLLYGAKRILQGDRLYRDFFDFTGPGSFYLYAIAFALGGTSVTTAHVTTSLLHTVAATCTYSLALRCASMGEALLAGLLVTVACGAAWNLATHNWVSTTFGLAAAAVLLAGGWQGSSRARPAAAGALAGAVACTHQTRGLAVIAWMAIAVPALASVNANGTRWRRCLRELWWATLGGAVVCVTILGYAVWRSSLAEMTYATQTWVLTSYRKANVGRIEWGEARWAAGPRLTFMWLVKTSRTTATCSS